MPKSFIGIALTLVAVVLGLITGVIVKDVANDIGFFTTLFYRFLFSVPLLLIYAVYVRGADFWRINQRQVLFWRIIFGTSGMVFWFLSLRTMPLGQATAMFQSSVLFVTLMSPLFLGERVGIYRWSAVVIGLLGVFIITDPFSGNMSIYVSYGVLAAVSGAVLAILLRRLGRGDVPASVALWYNGTGSVVMILVLLLMPDLIDPVGGSVLINLVALGVVASVQQICFTTSYKHADAVVVASMRYIQMPASAVVGYFLFAEVMTVTEITGACIIVASCLVIGWREMVRSRTRQSEAN